MTDNPIHPLAPLESESPLSRRDSSEGSNNPLCLVGLFPPPPVGWDHLTFMHTQEIQQRPNESSSELHERLRPQAIMSTTEIRKPTQIDAENALITDVSNIVGIKGAFAVMTSSCVHEMPYRILVGIAASETSCNDKHSVRLLDLGKDLTDAEKSAIYDQFRAPSE